ncbi:NtaA/DmoA family FMN-dependent monooxygenase (plasmid) [Rhodococcus globerulus]|uniref:NtaA/DmoA family FMN-dependent monooxygenase n=1 Tax=Rhodococcus globerulus TaxID=33008 RepID=UPI0039ED22C1
MTPKQIILAVHFPGVNNQTVWSDPAAGSQIDFASFVHMAQTAERGKFDFLFLAEGLRLREENGVLHDLDVAGRPDTLAVLAALAAVTSNLGLAGTLSTTYNEPYNLVRQLASLEQLSGGRSAWNLVTSLEAGTNFRRGNFLPYADRYERAEEFLTLAKTLWSSWGENEIIANKASGQFIADSTIGRFEHTSNHFDVSGRFTVPRSPQGQPVIFQAGDSPRGRDFAAMNAEAVFTWHGTLEAGQKYYTDLKRRVVKFGRNPDTLKVLPASGFVLGDTELEARERAHDIQLQQISPQTAIHQMQTIWNRDLSSYDPEGPLPDLDPVWPERPEDLGLIARKLLGDDPRATVARWRQMAEQRKLSIRTLMIELSGWEKFVGTPSEVAAQMNTYVQSNACDGFILNPHLVPTGLDEFVDKVVPQLQERGVFRTEYEYSTLRQNLGLPFHPPGIDERELTDR